MNAFHRLCAITAASAIPTTAGAVFLMKAPSIPVSVPVSKTDRVGEFKLADLPGWQRSVKVRSAKAYPVMSRGHKQTVWSSAEKWVTFSKTAGSDVAKIEFRVMTLQETVKSNDNVSSV